MRIKFAAGSQIHTRADTGLPNYQEYMHYASNNFGKFSTSAVVKAKQLKT